MKLNNKQTVFVGLAFMSICAFWGMYDNVIPLILTKTFAMNETVSGIIMALDNILALFLLPLFGAMSDKVNSPRGKRMPFIIFGTVVAVALLNILPILDNSYAKNPQTHTMIAFVGTLGLLLVVMGTYRSPAVALMPDVTPKPLRSKANAIINLMGAIGGALYLALAAVLYPKSKTDGLAHVDYQMLFIIVGAIMIISIIILRITTNEPKLVAANKELEAKHPEWNLAEEDGSGKEVLPRPVKKSLLFLLASIALWFIGYNGVTTWFTVYAESVMGKSLGEASVYTLIATIGAVVSYIPIGIVASKFGRKKTIMFGCILLAASFGAGYFLTTTSWGAGFVMYVVFVLVGLAWAAINVNSLPMVVEMCKGSDIGKFTGYYYTASMAAQVVTPIVAGTLMRNIDYKVLFPYAALFVALSFVTMCFVKHGDVKVDAKKGLDAYEEMD